MEDRRIEILMEMIRRRRAAKSQVDTQPAGSKRISDFADLFSTIKAQHVQTNPFREPDKRFGGGQRKKKKKKVKNG